MTDLERFVGVRWREGDAEDGSEEEDDEEARNTEVFCIAGTLNLLLVPLSPPRGEDTGEDEVDLENNFRSFGGVC